MHYKIGSTSAFYVLSLILWVSPLIASLCPHACEVMNRIHMAKQMSGAEYETSVTRASHTNVNYKDQNLFH